MSPTNNLTARQKACLQRLGDARDRLHTSIAGVEEGILSSEPVVDEWTVKDLIGHMISWNREFRLNIADILQGKHPGYDHKIPDTNDFAESNQAWIESKKDWTFEKMLDDLEQDFNDAVDLILNLTPKELRLRGVTPWKDAADTKPAEPTTRETDSVETLINYHWRHMNMHTKQIEKWREKIG